LLCLRNARAFPLLPAALASVPFGFVLVRVRVQGLHDLGNSIPPFATITNGSSLHWRQLRNLLLSPTCTPCTWLIKAFWDLQVLNRRRSRQRATQWACHLLLSTFTPRPVTNKGSIKGAKKSSTSFFFVRLFSIVPLRFPSLFLQELAST